MSDPTFRLRVLLALMLLVLVLAAFGGVTTLLVRLGWRRANAIDRTIARAAGGLTLIGVVCFLYALFVEADTLVINELRIESPKLPAGKKYVIAHLTDLHVDRESRALMKLRNELTKRQLDLLFFTGDAVNSIASVDDFRTTLGSIRAQLGRFAVRGNHDVYRWGHVDLFGGGVATELLADTPLFLDDHRLAVCGAPFDAPDEIATCLAHTPKTAFTILAYHSPDLVEELAARPDLYLTGHTHGGQVRVPLYGAVITFSKFDKKYEMGRYDVNGTVMYVNRGIGFEPSLPRIRFLAPPELALIEVVGTGPPAAVLR